MNNIDFIKLHDVTAKNIDSILETIPASIYCKNRKGTYLDCNKMFISVSNSKTQSDVIGSSDFDFIWKNHAPNMQKNDLSIIRSGNFDTFIEKATDALNNEIFYLSYKSPLRSNSKKIIGTIGFSFPMDNSLLKNHFRSCNFKTDFSNSIAQQTYNLTHRQIECLHYLAKGMTMKQIAKTLSLSPKTIEHHFDAIKNKLGCSSRYELIQVAFEIG